MYNYNYFDENFYKESNDLYRNVNMPSLFNPTVGYDNGNLFSGLYQQYKNYRPVTLTANNERERMLLDLSRMAFAAHELNLYLDTHPDDTSMITLFNDYRTKSNELIKDYEKKYGPINISSDSLNDKTPFAWEQNTWPWEERFNV